MTSHHSNLNTRHVFIIRKEYRFEAAHHLPNHNGKCRRAHGHSYRVEIAIAADELKPVAVSLAFGSSSENMVMDFADLDALVKPVIDELDHQDLNTLPFLAPFLPPTAEALCEFFRWTLADEFDDPKVWLYSVRVWETEKSSAEWRLA